MNKPPPGTCTNCRLKTSTFDRCDRACAGAGPATKLSAANATATLKKDERRIADFERSTIEKVALQHDAAACVVSVPVSPRDDAAVVGEQPAGGAVIGDLSEVDDGGCRFRGVPAAGRRPWVEVGGAHARRESVDLEAVGLQRLGVEEREGVEGGL